VDDVRRLAVGEDSEIEVALDEFAPDEFAPAGARRVIATALVVEVDE
jgi:hypothetical protein